MAGYVNSWIEKYQDTPPACIGDTINQSYDGNGSNIGLGPIGSCWMWLIIGAIAGYVIKDQKK
jgi:hypothetical protein